MQASNETDILAKRLDYLTRKILPLLGEGWTLDAAKCSFSKLVVPTPAEETYAISCSTLKVSVLERMVGSYKQRGTGKLKICVHLGHGRGSDYNRTYEVKDDGSFNAKKLLATIEEFKARAKHDVEQAARRVSALAEREARRTTTQETFKAAFPGQFEKEYSTMSLPRGGGVSMHEGGWGMNVRALVKNPETLKAIIALLEKDAQS